MKRSLSVLLALTLVFALAACSNEKDTASNPDTSTTIQTESTTPSTSTPSTPSTPTKPALPFSDLFSGGNALALTDKNMNGITANRVLNRSSYEIFHAYIFDNLSSIETKDWKYQLGDVTHNLKQYAVPESVVYQYAAQFFNIDTATKNILKASDRYDSSKGVYWIYDNSPWFSSGDDAEIKGYDNLGNDEYTVYAQAKEVDHLWPCADCATTNSCVISQPCFKAKIKATGKSSYIVLSFEYIDTIPSNITKN